MSISTGMVASTDVTAAGSNTISDALQFNAVEGIFIGSSTSTLTLSNALTSTSTGGLTIGGGGTLILGTANTYTGTTTLNSGILGLGNTTALGSSTAPLNVDGGTIQATVGGLTFANPIALNTGTGALTVSGANSLTLNGLISGSGSLIENMTAAGVTLTLTGAADTYTGATIVNAGTLSLGKTAPSVIGPLVIGNGGAVAATVTQTVINEIAATSAVTVNNTGTLNLNNLVNTVAIPSLLLDGGTVTIGTGTLLLGGNIQTLASATAATITGTTGALSLGANRVFNVAASGNGNDLNISSVISGAFEIVKIGGGTLTYSNSTANTYTGQTSVDEGTLVLAETALGDRPRVWQHAGRRRFRQQRRGQGDGRVPAEITANNNAVIVNGSSTLDISGSTSAQSIGALDVRGATVKTGTNTLTEIREP